MTEQAKRPARFWMASACAGVFLLICGGWLEWRVRSAPIPSSLEAPPPATPVLEDMRGRCFSSPAADFARDARPMRLKDFGRWLPLATVAVEDRRFYSHGRIDHYPTNRQAGDRPLAADVWSEVARGV